MATFDMPTVNNNAEETTKKRRGRPKKTDNVKMEGDQISISNIAEKQPDEQEEAPKTKRGGRRKKSDETTETSTTKTGKRRKGWSDDQPNNKPVDGRIASVKEFMYIEIELLREALGMMPSDPNLVDAFIGTKAPDAKTREQEVAESSEQEVVENMSTIWPIGRFYVDADHDNLLVDKADPFTDPAIKAIADDADCIIRAPYLYDYQVRGMFKDSCGMLWRAKGQNLSSGLKAYKKIIDGGIYVFPRHVGIELPETYIDDDGNIKRTYNENGKLFLKQRSLRTSSPQGQFNALASSEVIPSGSRMRFIIGLTDPSFRPYIEEWLDYGLIRGIGQWRNSGTGIFRWRECNEDWTPVE